MEYENEISYPSVGQSWGLMGLCILIMLAFAPVKMLLDHWANDDISFFVYYTLSMGACFWLAHRKRRNRTNLTGYDWTLGSWKLILLVGVAALALQIGLISPLVSFIPMNDFMKKLLMEYAQNKGAFSVLAVVLAAPILEELIFRGVILDGLLKYYSPVKSIVVSSLLFGIIHLNPWQFVGAFLIGLFAGWVYYRTGKLTLCIFIHFANNLLASVASYFVDPETMFNESLVESYGGVLNLVLGTAGSLGVLLVCLYFLRQEFRKPKVSLALAESQSVPVS